VELNNNEKNESRDLSGHEQRMIYLENLKKFRFDYIFDNLSREKMEFSANMIMMGFGSLIALEDLNIDKPIAAGCFLLALLEAYKAWRDSKGKYDAEVRRLEMEETLLEEYYTNLSDDVKLKRDII